MEEPFSLKSRFFQKVQYVGNHPTNATDPNGLEEEHKKNKRKSTEEKHQRGQGRRAADQARARMREEQRLEATAPQTEVQVKIDKAVSESKIELDAIEKRLKRTKDCFERSALESRKTILKKEIAEMKSIIVYDRGRISKETVQKLSAGAKTRLAKFGLVLSVVADVGDAIVWYRENAPVGGHPGARVVFDEYTWTDEGGSFTIRVEERWTFRGIFAYYKEYYCGPLAGQSFEISRATKYEYVEEHKRVNGYFRWQWYYWEWVPGTERAEPPEYYDLNGDGIPGSWFEEQEGLRL